MKKLTFIIAAALCLSACGAHAGESVTSVSEISEITETVSETETEKPTEISKELPSETTALTTVEKTEGSAEAAAEESETVSETTTDTTVGTSAQTVSETETASETETSAPQSAKIPPVVLAVVGENHAWGHQQAIALVASDGKCYMQECGSDDFDSEKWIHFGKDADWYDKLLSMTEGESEAELTDEMLSDVLDFAPDFGKYEGAEEKNYGNHFMDFGSYTMYGFYYGENSEPKKIKLCVYGDWVYCIDDENVKAFANKMSEYGIMFTMGDFVYD